MRLVDSNFSHSTSNAAVIKAIKKKLPIACFASHKIFVLRRNWRNMGSSLSTKPTPKRICRFGWSPALAFMPPDVIEFVFEGLAPEIAEEFLPVLDYFEDNYIGCTSLLLKVDGLNFPRIYGPCTTGRRTLTCVGCPSPMTRTVWDETSNDLEVHRKATIRSENYWEETEVRQTFEKNRHGVWQDKSAVVSSLNSQFIPKMTPISH